YFPAMLMFAVGNGGLNTLQAGSGKTATCLQRQGEKMFEESLQHCHGCLLPAPGGTASAEAAAATAAESATTESSAKATASGASAASAVFPKDEQRQKYHQKQQQLQGQAADKAHCCRNPCGGQPCQWFAEQAAQNAPREHYPAHSP